MTLEGLEVLLLSPDFASAPKLVGNQKVDTVAGGESARIQAYVGDHPLHAFAHNFKFTDRVTASILEDFVFDRAGNWQPFWIPSWHAELNPVATIENGGDELSISPVNYSTTYDPTHANVARLGHYIFLLHYDGTMLIRKVTGVTGTSPEVLTLDSPVTREFALGNFAVGFVYCVTLLSDELALVFSNENSEAKLSFAEEGMIDAPDANESNQSGPSLLVADYSTDLESGDPPLTVEFTDESLGTPVSWLWNFGDGTANSTDQNPTHEFVDDGLFSVRLTVTDASGATSRITKEILVNSPPVTPDDPLTADFDFTPSGGDAALDVAFTDTSIGVPIVWLWNFGDGTTSAEQNPEHTFVLPGTYTIVLQIRDTNGSNSTKVDSITVTLATPVATTCDSGASYLNPPPTVLNCGACCTALDAMAVDDIAIWTQSALENCLGLTVADGMTFLFNSKTFGVAYDYPNNTNGSRNIAGDVYYDVVRIS